jgi:hypothetical protein
MCQSGSVGCGTHHPLHLAQDASGSPFNAPSPPKYRIGLSAGLGSQPLGDDARLSGPAPLVQALAIRVKTHKCEYYEGRGDRRR